MFTNVTS